MNAGEQNPRVPRPDVVIGPPLEQYFTLAQLQNARREGEEQGRIDAQIAFYRRSLWSIAWERFDRWLRRL